MSRMPTTATSPPERLTSRHLLFLGVPTNVGQVTSIRTLEKQIRRLGASEYEELRSLAAEIAESCASAPACALTMGVHEPSPQPLALWMRTVTSRSRART
jgi:hypothetical protein